MDSLYGIIDVIDILSFAILIYALFRVMKSSGTINLFYGIVSILVLWIVVSKILEMRLLGSIMNSLVSVGAIIIVVLFQDEIRRFLVNLGSQKRWKYLLRLFIPEKNVTENPSNMLFVMAARNMAKTKTGAIIAIETSNDLKNYALTGEKIDAEISVRLIENVFFKNSPLHDGAMIIANNRIQAAGCILPVSHSLELPKELGLRHRAALGLSQETDAKIIVVSEERGKISFFYNGKMTRNVTEQELEKLLADSKKDASCEL